MIGYKLTTEQATEISGKLFNESTAFNPVKDINEDWFIFEGEINGHITVAEFAWVKTLKPSEYLPRIIEQP
jgi:hypothetical protein